MIKQLLSFLSVLFLCSQAFSQNALLENLDTKVQKKWRASLSATHLDGFGDERIEPATVFRLGLNYQLSKRVALTGSSRLTKRYYVNFSSDREAIFSDPYIGLRHSFKGRILGGAIPMLSYGLLLPLSEFSSRNDIQGRLYIGGSSTWSLSKHLMLTGSLSGIYQINKYSTTGTASLGSGGTLLPHYSVSGDLGFAYSLGNSLGFKGRFLKSLFLSFGGTYNRTTLEQFQSAPVQVSSFRRRDFDYILNASLAASPVKNLFVSVGYGHEGNIEEFGRTEYHLFDPLATRWRVGARYTIRF